MIDFIQVSKAFGAQEILRNASFRINEGERAGIVGPNGTGKSTVFGLICGEASPDKGTVELPRGVRIGHLRQQLDPHEVTDTLLSHAETGRPDLQETENAIHAIEDDLHHDRIQDKEAALRRLGELQTAFEAEGGYRARSQAEATLCGLGFSESDFGRPFKSFSGGWQMRAELARVLVADPRILLLDEPTNYLDIPAVEWLQKYLKSYSGTMLLISHDRYLLNTLTSVTIEVANGETTKYTGNYDHYVEARKLGHEQRLAGQKNQQRERERAERFIERFRAKNTKATQVKSRMKMLERMEEITLQKAVVSHGRIRLKKPARCGHEVVRVADLGLTYDGSTWVLRNVELQVHRGDKIAIIGPNGMGKSTLLRVLAGKLVPSEGKRFLGHNVVVGYQSQEFTETMDPDLTVFDTIRRQGGDASDQDVRTLLGGFGFSGDAVEKRVSVLSGGEKVRLAFARLLIDPPNFLILDEPTTHLDIQARESLEKALAEFEGTICLVSHDIEFVRHVATSTIAMRPGGIERYPGGYDYYCEKMAERESKAPKQAGPTRSTLDRKAERRERAETVQKRGQQRRELQKKLSATEKHIFELEEEQTALLAQLESAGTVVDYAKVNRRLQQIAAELSIATELWEQQASAVEEV